MLADRNIRCEYEQVSIANQRPSNMDSVHVGERMIDGHHCVFAVVCDGVGSLTEGGYASSAATELLAEWFEGLDSADSSFGIRLRDRIIAANAEIVASAEKLGIGTASTLTAFMMVDARRYAVVHLGDTRAYSFAESFVSQLTADQVTETGKLQGYIGRVSTIYPSYRESEIASGSCVFLLCSDGFYKRSDNREIGLFMREWNKTRGGGLMRERLDLLVQRGEKDNISCVVIGVDTASEPDSDALSIGKDREMRIENA